MPISKFQLYLDTLTHPMTLFYRTQKTPWINNQFINHTFDLIELLKMLPRDGAPKPAPLKDFFFPNSTNLNTAQYEVATFGQIRSQFLQSINNDQFLLSLKRYALLKMIATLAEDDFAKITRLFVEEPAGMQMSRDEYEESLAVLCRVLKNQLAQINGITSNAPMHTPTDHYTALDNLIVALKQTQRKYGHYDNPTGLYLQGTTQSLQARRWLYGLTILTGVLLGFVIKAAVNNHAFNAVAYSLLTCYMAYKTIQALYRMEHLHQRCEAEHADTASKFRQSLGLPEPEPELIPEPEPNGVTKMWLKARNYMRRQTELQYNPLINEDDSTRRLLDEPHGDDHVGPELVMVRPTV